MSSYDFGLMYRCCNSKSDTIVIRNSVICNHCGKQLIHIGPPIEYGSISQQGKFHSATQKPKDLGKC